MKKNWLVVVISLFISILLISCGEVEEQDKVSPLQIKNGAIEDQTITNDAKKEILAMKEVVEVKGVNLKENIYLAPRVTHFQRLRLEEIRKTAFEKVKKRYPEANVHVSTDKKIYMELDKLEQQLKNKTISAETFEQKLKKLEKDMKG